MKHHLTMLAISAISGALGFPIGVMLGQAVRAFLLGG